MHLRLHLRLLWMPALAVWLAGCGDKAEEPVEKPTLTLFVAASLTDVIQEAGAAYEAEHEVEVVYNFAGSGALAHQLLAAPRADLFLSASERWMDEVEAGNRLWAGSRRTLLSNSLVVIANLNSEYRISQPVDLCEPAFAYLAIGDPESVPAGRYAQGWLESLACPDGGSVWSKVERLVSPAPDVRAALTQVQGSFDVAGIVYRTDFMARKDRVRLVYEVPVAEGPKIQYPAAIINTTKSPQLAQDFLEFLSSSEARVIFERNGFAVFH